MSRTFRTVDLSADVIATADIIARIEEIRTDENGIDNPERYSNPEMAEELAVLESIMEELSTSGGGDEKWEGQWYPGTLIADHYFTDYAREMLYDCGTIPESLPHWVEIDWDATARNVRVDYTPVEVNGRTYWTR